MNIINRGVVGDWRKAGRKVISAMVYVASMVILTALLGWVFITGYTDAAGGIGVLWFMGVLAVNDAHLGYLMSWVFDDVEMAVPVC